MLWLVRDGVGFAFARKRRMHQASKAITRMVIGTMNHKVYSSNQVISCMMPVAAG